MEINFLYLGNHSQGIHFFIVSFPFISSQVRLPFCKREQGKQIISSERTIRLSRRFPMSVGRLCAKKIQVYSSPVEATQDVDSTIYMWAPNGGKRVGLVLEETFLSVYQMHILRVEGRHANDMIQPMTQGLRRHCMSNTWCHSFICLVLASYGSIWQRDRVPRKRQCRLSM